MDERLGKAYKLCSKKVIDDLFKNGHQIKQYPFILQFDYALLPTKKKFQIVTSVPKRIHKKAVQRNRIKRLMREVIRKKKHLIEENFSSDEKQLALFLIYTGKKEESYSLLLNKIEVLFERLMNAEEKSN
ncbi:MAG: ribonuclease P protein component [Brumimicrobium sp.]